MKKIDQSLAIILVLLILLQVKLPFINHHFTVVAKLFLSFLIVFLIYFNVSGNIRISALIGVIVVIILYSLDMHYINASLGLYEGFDEQKDNNLIDKINNEYNDIKVGKVVDNSDDDVSKGGVISIDDVKKIDIDDAPSDIEGEDDDVTMTKHNKPIDKYTPAEAQRETYRLIDTVRQLETTVKNLTPTLTEGKRVLEAFEKMNLDEIKI
jgi:antitoxin (DNA-binding transcriptional repressor) of toxin-antitoxin stability system